MRVVRPSAPHHDLHAVRRLRTTRARAPHAGAGADAGGARVLRVAGAALRARRLRRFPAARGRPRSPDPAGAAGALRVARPADRHLRPGRRRLRGGVPRPASHAARPAAHRARCRVGHQHPRRPPARQRRRGVAGRGRRQPAHPGRRGDGPRAGEGGAARKPGVQRGHRERRCPHHRDPARDARRRDVPWPARPAQRAADRALGGGPRRRRTTPDRRRARRHRAVLRIRQTPHHREPAGRDRCHPGRAGRARRRRHPAPGRRADESRTTWSPSYATTS